MTFELVDIQLSIATVTAEQKIKTWAVAPIQQWVLKSKYKKLQLKHKAKYPIV